MAKKFYAQKDALGFPIPGTMMSADVVPVNSVEIPPTELVPVWNQVQIKRGDLRYFVRKDVKGNIIPNSLIISLKRPKGLVYEFKIVVGDPIGE